MMEFQAGQVWEATLKRGGVVRREILSVRVSRSCNPRWNDVTYREVGKSWQYSIFARNFARWVQKHGATLLPSQE